ncbi:MAG: anti-sigma factor family protein [Pyrinomonadaceae bacterium]
MKCDDCLRVIEEYFDGELNTQDELQLREHLDNCSSCSSVLENLRADQAVYAHYDSSIEVSPQLWAGVRARIASHGPAPRVSALQRFQVWLGNTFALPSVSGAVAAALVIFSVGLTIVVMKYISWPAKDRAPVVSQTSSGDIPAPETGKNTTGPGAVAPRPPGNEEGQKIAGKFGSRPVAATNRSKPPSHKREATAVTKTPDQLVREAEQKYLAAIAMLSRNVERRRSRLDAATFARLEQALASIDRTIAETRKAVRRHPEDPVAAQYMLTAYAKKIDVLREMVDNR